MRILVQNAASKVYFDGLDWNENAAQAKVFENVAQAEAFCFNHALFSALIVVETNDGKSDFSYPVGGQAILVSKPDTTRIRSLC